MNAPQEFPLFLRATLSLYGTCAQKATERMIRNGGAFAGALFLYMLYAFSSRLLAPLGFGWAFLVGLIEIVLLALYYTWISTIQRDEKVTFSNAFQLDYHLFFQLISVAFIFSIGFLLLFGALGQTGAITIILRFAIFVVFNAVAEVVYIHRFESLHALSHAANFLRENWLEWFIPLVILLLPVGLVTPALLVSILAAAEVLLPAQPVGTTFLIFLGSIFPPLTGGTFLLLAALSSIPVHWYMLFRGELFQRLETSTRRKRMFEARSH